MTAGAFSPRAVLGIVLFGALTFAAMLWFIGQGDTGPGPDNGQAHARGHGLTGYAGLVSMLQKQGVDVSVSRSPGRLDDESLLVLTPSAWADADDIAEIIDRRRYTGSTLLILPKWYAAKVPASLTGAKKGWVQLVGTARPGWTDDLGNGQEMSVKLATLAAGPSDWRGLGLSGRLPERKSVLGLEEGPWTSLVRDSKGRDLVAYANDHGCYPILDAAAGQAAPEAECDTDKWSLVVAFEPDLFDNYGLADRNRALLAAKVIDIAREGQDVPVVFDLTLNGFGANKNLLTLAFQPPFIAATLCLILALIVVGWRAFARFGPPVAEARTIAFGKARLASNAAGFIRRSGRLHLLATPFADLVARRLAHALGLRRADPIEIDAALGRLDPDGPTFTQLADRLAAARGASQTVRAAHALKSLERTVTR
jgi:hypothetical protein